MSVRKVPDGYQFELWWPQTQKEFPQSLVSISFDREVIRAELTRRLAEDSRDDYKLVAANGWDVYEITLEQL